MFNLRSVKTQLIIFLAGLALFLSAKDKDAAFLLSTFAAVVAAAGLDSVINYFKSGQIKLSDSSCITGLIIGFVLSSDTPWWMFVLAAFFAIGSKHLIRIKERHLFNPAAFGIFLCVFFFMANTQWKGTYAWYALVPFGLYFSFKIRRLELLLSYLIVSLVLFGIKAWLAKIPLSSVFGYFSYFFIFIMLIEPKTTPVRILGKIIFGSAVATLIFVMTELGIKIDAELLALLVVNPLSPLLSMIPERRKVRR